MPVFPEAPHGRVVLLPVVHVEPVFLLGLFDGARQVEEAFRVERVGDDAVGNLKNKLIGEKSVTGAYHRFESRECNATRSLHHNRVRRTVVAGHLRALLFKLEWFESDYDFQ